MTFAILMRQIRHDNCCSSLGGIAQLVERLVRNESTANMLTLSHALTRAQLEGTALNRGYLTLSHEPRNHKGEPNKQCNNARARSPALCLTVPRARARKGRVAFELPNTLTF